MDTQRNNIGDRAGPGEVPASGQARDSAEGLPPVSRGGSPALPQSSSPQVQTCTRTANLGGASQANLGAIGKLESLQHDLRVRSRDVANGDSHALLVVGPGGLGKTHVVNATLKAHPGVVVTRLNSHCTPLAFYEQLHKHKTSANILVLEDMEETLENKTVQGLLRSATDGPKDRNARKERMVRWNSTSAKLADLKLPAQFKFEGRIIIIANSTPDNSTWRAFETRCRRVIFEATPEEVIAFMRHLTRDDYMIDTATGPARILASECAEVIDYMAQKHITNLRDLDHALSDYYLHRPNDEWKGLLDRELAHDASQTLGSAASILRALAKSGLPVKDQQKEFTQQTGLGRSVYFNLKQRLGLS